MNKVKLSVFGQYHHGQRQGEGSFVNDLMKLFYLADPGNRTKLVKAFPEYFKENDILLNY